MRRKKTGVQKADAYAALRDFVRGYLHQDYAVEHGTPASAATAFCRDASAAERRLVLKQLQQFMRVGAAIPGANLTERWIRELGEGWRPTAKHELDELAAALAAGRQVSSRTGSK